METKQCPSCSIPFQGKYCSQCGEKQVNSKDFTIVNLIKEGFSFFTNLDSKLYQTIKGLLFKPGFLPQEYIAGRRSKYMKPFQVFIISSILFYIFLSDMDIFLIPSKWFFTEETQGLIDQVVKRKGITEELVAIQYDAQVINNSKLFIFLLLPVLAGLVYMFNWKKVKEFGKYIIDAIYIMSFFMVVTALITALIDSLPYLIDKWWFIISIQLFFLVYIILSLKKGYDRPVWYASLQGIIVMILFGFFMGVYRYGISYYTLFML